MTRERELLGVATEAVEEGARWLADAGTAWSRTRFKPSGEEVTDADVEVERRISAVLARRTPDVPVVGEESGPGGPLPRRCWLLDPIDGTMNFARGGPLYGLSLAYVVEGVPRLGVIDAPALGRRWSAGAGDFPVEEATGPGSLSRAVVGVSGTGGSRWGTFLGRLHDEAYRVRSHGAMSLDLVGVAEGWIDACLCIGPQPWDVAAGTVLVRERGGAVLGAGGTDFTWGSVVLAAGPRSLARELVARWEAAAAGGPGS
ncbi:inositol monophosphatase family protein [Streptomyces sp. QHH-9511]|uniref:inositol monophosphatase family protein n=1 Tax=Streptomyces sp. QHH-9511 TaxID=2684468 RepID=UPI001318282E|nr:inositol monophosphatase family protein [Streptomyces sp. QHH-9511]QGZ48458.1 inositol monophosphatase family protein [Streptomyces sp. QHH-9511]